MLTVITYLWHDETRDSRGYKFNHDHVRTLQSMINRHLTVPHKFICITDDEIEGVETFRLDYRRHVPGTCLIKLMHWNPDVANKLGTRILCLDLDIVITANIDGLMWFRPEDVVLFRNPNFPKPRRAFYQGSVQLFAAGARPQIWSDMTPDTLNWLNWRFGGAEQCWISERLEWNEAHFDHSHGIYGAGRLGDWSDKNVIDVLPDNAKIVVFPGAREPGQSDVQEKHKWIREHYR